MTTPLAPIDSTQLPADVRKGGAKAEQLYATALQFENVLTEQLAQAIVPAQQDGGDSASDGTTSLYDQMLPQAFGQGVTAAGGLGLARDLYEALKQS